MPSTMLHTLAHASTLLGEEAIDKYIIVGERTVRLRFSHISLLEPMFSALAHLEQEQPNTPPDLTISILDCKRLDLARPQITTDLPWRQHGNTDYIESQDLFCESNNYTGALSIYQPSAKIAAYWLHCSEEISIYEQGAPLQKILRWFTSHDGWQLLHAAVLGLNNQGILLAGWPRAGKSTTTLSCLREGFQYITDDKCLVRIEQHQVVAYSLYNAAKLTQESAAWFPDLAAQSHAVDPSNGKRLLFLYPAAKQQLVRQMPVRAIVVPTLRSPRLAPRLTSIAKGEVLRILGPSTVVQFAGGEGTGLHLMAKLVAALPCYALELGPPATNPACIAELINSFS